jgi:hypothetical protein
MGTVAGAELAPPFFQLLQRQRRGFGLLPGDRSRLRVAITGKENAIALKLPPIFSR